MRAVRAVCAVVQVVDRRGLRQQADDPGVTVDLDHLAVRRQPARSPAEPPDQNATDSLKRQHRYLYGIRTPADQGEPGATPSWAARRASSDLECTPSLA
jgi:hypothetical protein